MEEGAGGLVGEGAVEGVGEGLTFCHVTFFRTAEKTFNELSKINEY